MNKFILAKDETQKRELISCGFRLISQSQGRDGNIYVFLNDKKLYEQYAQHKSLITTNTLTF